MSNDVLDNLQYLPDGGALLFGGQRLLLMPPECLTDCQKALETELGADRAGQIIYRAAHQQGSLLTSRVLDELSLGQNDAVRYIVQLSRQMGWGRTEITNLSLGHGTLELEVYHSPFAEGYRQASFPVCHHLRGFYAGMLQALFNVEVGGLETRCRAVDGPGPCVLVYAVHLHASPMLDDKNLTITSSTGES